MAIAPPGPRVRVQDVQHRPGRRNPWLARWTVAGRPFSSSWKTKDEAEGFQARLRVNARDGARFDPDTGMPPGFSDGKNVRTIATTAFEFFEYFHANWAPRTRRNYAQAFGVVLPLIVKRTRKGSAPADINLQIEAWLGGASAIPPWLSDASIALDIITPQICREIERDIKGIQVLDRRASKGSKVMKPISASDVRRHIASIRAVLNHAVKQGLIAEHPWPPGSNTRRFKTDRSQVKTAIDTEKLPDLPTVRSFLEALVNHKPQSHGYRVIAACIFYLGLRPSEALALQVQNVHLPAAGVGGWGHALIDTSITSAGKRWTGPGEETGLPKTGVVRTVPIPPDLRKILRVWIGARQSGLLVHTKNFGPVLITNLDRAFRVASEKLDVEIRPYDLRHTCATLMLRSGVPLGEAARRLGHSPTMLLNTYAGIMKDDETIANELIEKAFSV